MLRRTAVALLATTLAAATTTTAQNAPLRFVAGLPVVRVVLRAGETTYECHLLIDLARFEALFLHDNAARSLGALAVDLRAGELELTQLPVAGGSDRWLERFTAEHATELNEVPLAGRLGLGAFRDGTLVLDGPGRSLELRSAAAGVTRPPADATRAVVDLLGKVGTHGLSFGVELGATKAATFVVDTSNAACHVAPRILKELDKPVGNLDHARVGPLDLAAFTPFRPEAPTALADGTLGGRVLMQLVLTAAPSAGWLALEAPAPPSFPADEAAFYAARYGAEPVDDLATFVVEHADSTFRFEAARDRLALIARDPGADPEIVVEAARLALDATVENARGREALRMLEAMPDAPIWDDARQELATAALPMAQKDEDGTATHKLRLVLGRLARQNGEFKEARRHLLSAAFGMPGDGPVNLELGRLYEKQDQLERARSRYLLALLDMEDTGVDGLLALRRVHEALGDERELADVLLEMSEGRVPALHPIPREPEDVHPTGRIVLCELFTGAMCPPCAAADVAFDALGELFGDNEVALVQWHLPIPAPEPLVSEVARTRARVLGVRGTPTAVFAGTEQIVGGGKADQAPDLFAKYERQVTALLAADPIAQIEASARIDSGAVHLEASATAERDDLLLHAALTERTLIFPGRNGILFHHHVARALLTPPGGVPITTFVGDSPWQGRRTLVDVGDELDETVTALETRGAFRIRPTDPDPQHLSVVLWLEAPDGAVVQALTIDVVPGA